MTMIDILLKLYQDKTTSHVDKCHIRRKNSGPKMKSELEMPNLHCIGDKFFNGCWGGRLPTESILRMYDVKVRGRIVF